MFSDGHEAWEKTYAQIKGHILYCHLKDGYRMADGKFGYVYLGAGDLPLAPIMARLKADGYASYFSFEWEKKWIPELDAPEKVFPHFVHKARATWESA